MSRTTLLAATLLLTMTLARAGDGMIGCRVETAFTLEPNYDARWVDIRVGREAIRFERNEWTGQKECGAKLTDIVSGSPADLADLRAGDVVVRVNDTDIRKSEVFLAALNSRRAGDEVAVTVIRNGVKLKKSVTLATRSDAVPARKIARTAEEAREELRDLRAKFYPEAESLADRIEAIDFDSYSNETDRALQDVSKLPAVRFLRYPLSSGKRTPITNAGFKALASMTSLRTLILEDTGWNDDSLGLLLDKLTLHHLVLKKTTVTAAMLEKIGRQSQLEALVIEDCKVDDKGLKCLGGLKKLRHLELHKANLLKDSSFLGKLDKLEYLRLDECLFGNKQAACLAELKELCLLSLANTEVSDEALASLAGLSKLLVLDLSHTGETILRSELEKRQKQARAAVLGGTASARAKDDEKKAEHENPLLEEEASGRQAEFQGSRGVSDDKTVRLHVTAPTLGEQLAKLRELRVLKLSGQRYPGGEVRDLAKVWPSATIITADKTIQPPQIRR